MAKKRVYEVAKELGVSSKKFIEVLEKNDIPVKSHMSTLDTHQINWIKKKMAEKDTQPKSANRSDTGSKKEGPRKTERSEQRKPSAPERPEQRKPSAPGRPEQKKPSAPGRPEQRKPSAPGRPSNEKHTSPGDSKGDRRRSERPGQKHREKPSGRRPSSRPGRRAKTPVKPKEIALAKSVKKRTISVEGDITVGSLAQEMGVKATEVIKKLMSMGIMATINERIDYETAAIVGEEFGYIIVNVRPQDALQIEEPEDTPKTLVERPPIVTVMGHVDHGKTSLLDAIRDTKVTAQEAGGITQHIGAYQVKISGRWITFLDTPGHEAFTAMRARGAQATDIAILVVAADDGVMPQTVEAINHAKAAEIPIIIAVNKIDKPNAAPDVVKQQLTEHGLIPEEWGGETVFVEISATKRTGIDNLLEMILLVAEMEELRANPDRRALGIVIESELDKGRGPVATVIVQKGTLRNGDSIAVGTTYGKVRSMVNDKGRRVKEATPSVPVQVQGFNEVPKAGETFYVVEDKDAKTVSQRRKEQSREQELQQKRVSVDDLFKNFGDGTVKELNLVLKADVHGSVEAIRQSLDQLNGEEVKINIIHAGVGAITETDVMLAAASNAVIVGFNVRPDGNTKKAAENEGVEIRLYRVIYEMIDEVKGIMSGLLDPEFKEKTLGRAEVRATFKVPKVGTIAGCYVTEGKITNKSKIRVIRDSVVVHEGEIGSLKRFKDDTKEVEQGFECGIGVANYNDIKVGDILEAYIIEEIERRL